MVENHNGYGLRNDEKPYAHKISEGGNWRDLDEKEQRAFLGGAYHSSGGKVGFLRKIAWHEPAMTIVTSPLAKATCQLHPGVLNRRETIDIRNYNVTPQLSPNGLTIAELFCGGGLMAVGLKASGYEITFANDFDKRAVQAYAHNLGDYVVCGDITSGEIQAQIPDTDIIAGGPPCQDFSVAGSGAGEEGERGKLVWTYLSTIERKKPKAFVFENVKGLITKRHRPTFDTLLEKFGEIGYTVSWQVVNAWDYGVAQKRERVFIVGIRNDFGFTFEFPSADPSGYRTKILRDVIGDLPEPFANHSPEEKLPNYVQNIIDGKSKSNFGKMPINDGSTPSRTLLASYGDKKPTEVYQPLELFNHRGTQTKFRDGKTQGDKIIPLSQASPTIRAEHHGNIEGFDTSEKLINRLGLGDNEYSGGEAKPRRFTVRECLRIQSVPDWYVLPSDISLSAQYRIVGNGVASRVAYVIGIALADQLNAALNVQEAA